MSRSNQIHSYYTHYTVLPNSKCYYAYASITSRLHGFAREGGGGRGRRGGREVGEGGSEVGDGGEGGKEWGGGWRERESEGGREPREGRRDGGREVGRDRGSVSCYQEESRCRKQ